MRFINRVIALLLALGMAVSLAGCSKEEMMGSLAGLMEKATGPIQPDKTLDGSAWRNSDIIGAVTETTQVSLKDDFHTAVNRDWMLTADTSEYGRRWGSSFSACSSRGTTPVMRKSCPKARPTI